MRNFKALAALLIGTISIGVLFLSPIDASADSLTAESYPVTLTGAQKSAFLLVFPTKGGVECEVATFTATASAAGTTVEKVAPKYEECEFAGIPAKATTTGCTYALHIGTGTTGTADLECEAGKALKFEATQAGTLKCVVEASTQTGLGTVTYRNIGSGTTQEAEVTLALKENVTVNATAGTGTGACTTGSTAKGSLTGSFALGGEKDGGSTHVGVFLSPIDASADSLTAESYPVTLTGAQKSAFLLVFPTKGGVECEVATFTATASAAGTTVEKVAPKYEECEFAGIPAKATTTGCTYALHIGTGTTGTADLECEAGKALKFEATQAGTLKCVVEASTQTGLGTVTYRNIGSGTTQEAEVTLALKENVTVNATAGTGTGACTTGSTAKGSLTGSFALGGEKDGGSTHVGVFLSPIDASADSLTAESYPVTLTGAQKSAFLLVFPTKGGVECEVATFTATASAAGTTVEKVAPKYEECEFAGIPAKATTTGCTYALHIGTGTTGTADLECEAGKALKFEATQAGTLKCVVEASTQTGLGTVTYRNIGSGTTQEAEVTLALKENVTVNATAGTGTGACTTGSTAKGSLTGSFALGGEKDGGSTHVGVFLSD